MTVVSIATYRRLAKDDLSTDGEITAALTDAQADVEAYLRRPLSTAERTERLRLYRYEGSPSGGLDGAWIVYPTATPITATAQGIVQGAGIVGATPDDGPWLYGQYETGGYSTVTYTGGYDVDAVPLPIAREIIRAAQASMSAATPVLAGATMIRLGDISANFDSPAAGVLDQRATSVLRPYVRRRAS